MDYDSVVNTIAAVGTLLAFAIAIVAYREAKKQGRITFELEILRELLELVQNDGFIRDLSEYPGTMATSYGVTARLQMLSAKSDLSLWYAAAGSPSRDDLLVKLAEHGRPVDEPDDHNRRMVALRGELAQGLYESLMLAIRTRMS